MRLFCILNTSGKKSKTVTDNKKAPVVQSSSGTQEIIIRDPAREERIRLKRYNDWAKSQKWIGYK